jgi:hypothetical protein
MDDVCDIWTVLTPCRTPTFYNFLKISWINDLRQLICVISSGLDLDVRQELPELDATELSRSCELFEKRRTGTGDGAPP